MGAQGAGYGSRVRALRRRAGVSQAQLARDLEISPSYLNLIEHNRRPLTADLLLRLARHFEVDLARFADEDEGATLRALTELFSDPVVGDDGVLSNRDMHALVADHPEVSQAILRLYEGYRDVRERVENLAVQIDGEAAAEEVGRYQLPHEEVHAFMQRHRNYFPELEAAAEALWRDGLLRETRVYDGLKSLLLDRHQVTIRTLDGDEMGAATRRFVPSQKELWMSRLLAPRERRFQLAHQLGLLGLSPLLDRLTDDPLLTQPPSRALARVMLANTFAGAVLMPYERFVAAAEKHRYDIEVLRDLFNTSFEQVCYRFTNLSRPGAEGLRFHMVRVDIAGNLTRRFSNTDLSFPRYGAGCARWSVHQAFLAPEQIRLQVSEDVDGKRYFSIARTVRRGRRGYRADTSLNALGIGCALEDAHRLVYADGMDLTHPDLVVPIGSSCRLCRRNDCAQRAFPAVNQSWAIDENARGVSTYGPAS
jgi:hypothetical protein